MAEKTENLVEGKIFRAQRGQALEFDHQRVEEANTKRTQINEPGRAAMSTVLYFLSVARDISSGKGGTCDDGW